MSGTEGAAKAQRWGSKPFHVYHPGDEVDGRYGVMRAIGSGGMAEVYEVIDKQSGELVALKTPNMRYAEQTQIVERMVREAKALAALRHENLVRVLDAGTYEDQFYFTMELLEGMTLRALSKERRLPLGVALTIARQLAHGVHALHHIGIIHRDLKPDNVFVLPSAGKEEHLVKVIDLGVAKFTDATTTSDSFSFGTVTYMSPEQIKGERVDRRADVYAMGLILYEMIAGVHPLERLSRAASANEWAQRQVESEPAPLDEVVPGVSPLIANLVTRSVAKRPGQRFDDAAELARQLDQAIKDLRGRGELGALRIEPFLAQSAKQVESGPRAVVRARPPNVATPDSGLPFARTDLPPDEEPRAPEPPLALKHEAPRVTPLEGAKTARGTVKMLGPKGTVPNLEVSPLPSPASGVAATAPEPAVRRALPSGGLWVPEAAAHQASEAVQTSSETSERPRIFSRMGAQAIAAGMVIAAMVVALVAHFAPRPEEQEEPVPVPLPRATSTKLDAPSTPAETAVHASAGAPTASTEPAQQTEKLSAPALSMRPQARASNSSLTKPLESAPRSTASARASAPTPDDNGPVEIWKK